MIRALPRQARRFAASLAALAAAACATGLPDVGPADIPRLERELAAAPGDTNLQVQLGIARFEAGDMQGAEAMLQGAVDAGNDSGAALLYLGMVREEQEDWSAAREAYTRYLDVGSSSEARDEVRKRLTLIGRNLLRAQARQALAQEEQIAGAAPVTPRSVAVLPLALNSDRADLEPLVYALSDMMVTDFGVSNALVVLERAQIQALLDEMALTSSGYAEPTTGARAGRLLRAEHVFQGVLTTLGGDDLQAEANVLNVPSTASAGGFTESAALERLFDLEKQLVIRTISEVLGVELTPAEEQAILENRMSNVLAFLAYGRGLREIDRGNFEQAQAELQLSMQLEPGSFPGRAAAIAEASDLADASAISTADLGEVATETGELGLGALAPPSSLTTDALQMATLNSVTDGVAPPPTGPTLDLGSAVQSRTEVTKHTRDTSRDAVQEATGGEVVAGSAGTQITIVIPRPGATP